MADQFVGNLRISTRADQLDAEQMAELEQGRAWEIIREKVRKMIAEHHQILETSADERAIARSQGAAQALRRVLELPGIVRKEAAQRAKER